MTATTVRTDGKSRVVLPGHPNETFVVRENADGSLLLEPAIVTVTTTAQDEYDNDAGLQHYLALAMSSMPVERNRRG